MERLIGSVVDVDFPAREGNQMKSLIFVSVTVACLFSAGCANRKTTITVYAEGNAYERSALYEAGGSARIAYRMDVEPALRNK